MEQCWFEMPEIRRRKLAAAVWIPLRSSQVIVREGQQGTTGFKEEFLGAGAIAVPADRKSDAAEVIWMQIGTNHGHSAWVDHGRYVPSDVHEWPQGELFGVPLVLDQHLTGSDRNVWHLHQDLVIALGLLREEDAWLCPNEGYAEVARLRRDSDGEPVLLEVRSEFLLDYLCARRMGLRVSSYHSRKEIVDDAGHIHWAEGSVVEEKPDERWEGRLIEIHEGGMPYGAGTSVLHISRTDVDPTEDVPDFDWPTDDSVRSQSYHIQHQGRKLILVFGECWRDEWIEPGQYSPRIRRDEVPGSVYFITDAAGKRETKETLIPSRRYLWFKPEVIPALAHRRGGGLGWYTRETGSVGCSPDHGVHFGVNTLGYINVFAKDIGELPEWQQRIWAGLNIGPDGGVSEELLASQMRCEPAGTVAPESRLVKSLSDLDGAFRLWKGAALFREHEERAAILSRVHRFRAVDRNGLFSLAKDMARLTADSIDVAELQKVVAPPKKEKWGSLKSLENVLASISAPDEARGLMTPLVGVYELRLGDAHLPGSKLDEALEMVNIDNSMPSVLQGACLIENCAIALESILSKLIAVAQANTPKGEE